MSQHVPETCNESNGSWLPLIEYSVKSGVSLSTIRRKIKSNSITFRLEKGKYLILFNDGETSAAQQPKTVERPTAPAPVEQRDTNPAKPPFTQQDHQEKLDRLVADSDKEPTVRMLSDAYEHALKEKDERIRILERRVREQQDRLNELQLLVRVLEEKYEVRY